MRKNKTFVYIFVILLIIAFSFQFVVARTITGINLPPQQITPILPPQGNNFYVSIIGDSHTVLGLTYAWDSLTHESKFKFNDYAKGGATILGGVNDNSLLNQLEQWDNDGRSDVLLIELGTNDIVWQQGGNPQEYLDWLDLKLNEYNVFSDSNVDIYFLNVPPVGSCFSDSKPYAPSEIVEYNNLLSQKYGEKVIDIHSSLLPMTNQYMQPDCLHWSYLSYFIGWVPPIQAKIQF